MNVFNQLHYHCLIDPSDGAIISQGETTLNETSPSEFGNRLIKRWGRQQLPSMQNRETRTLDYFYATNLIRPHRAVATVTKGPFVNVRKVTGSSDPGHEEHNDCDAGYEGCKPACYEEFPFPENPPDYLAKGNFYDPDAIKQALELCIEELKGAVSFDFTPDAVAKLVNRAEILVASTGGQGMHPHPNPFSGPCEEENAILILDLVIFAVLEVSPDTLPPDVIQAYKQRRENSDMSENALRQNLAWLKSDAK